MKNTMPVLLGFLLLSTPLPASAQLVYYDTGHGLVVEGVYGNWREVTVPSSSGNADPVIGIGSWAADDTDAGVTSVTIPNSVTGIGANAFATWESLITILVVGDNPAYSSLDGALFNKSRTTLLAFPAGKAGSYSVPGTVTSIGYGAFELCSSLTNLTIPGSVTNIGPSAFDGCTSLQGLYFKGNPPTFGAGLFGSATNATVYYLPATTGWGLTFAGRPTVLWNPLMQSSGVGPAGFGFNITGTADIPIVIDAATSLASAIWVPLQSLNLTNGAFYFSDPNWTNYPARFYRIRSP